MAVFTGLALERSRPVTSGRNPWYLSRSLDGRDVALDAFRGLAIAGMILVNNSNPGRPVYAPLMHTPWHGWTIADLVYPGFIFIVGVSIAISLAHDKGTQVGWRLYGKIFRRAALLFGIGLLLVGFPYYELQTWPLTGVLQRIAACYLVASLLFLRTTWRTQAIIAALLCVGYWLLLAVVPAPGFLAGDLSREGNLAGYVDRNVLGAHMDDGVFDSEGLLVTIPAVATALIGVLTGHWLKAGKPIIVKVYGMLAVGAGLVLLGLAWDSVLPVNKSLWTSSFVALSAGGSLLTLAFLYLLVNVYSMSRWVKPFEIFGVNSIVLYAGAYLLQRLLFHIRISDSDGARTRLRNLIFERAIDPLASGELGTLLYCVGFLFACWLALGVLYRKGIFIKL
jgi:predicted acyltransferase